MQKSYKKNILDVVNHANKNECDRVGIRKQDNDENVFRINIDIRQNRLVFIMWNGLAAAEYRDDIYIKQQQRKRRLEREERKERSEQ